MIRVLIILLVFLMSCAAPKECCSQIKKAIKFSTFYVAANGGTSLSDRDVYSLDGSTLDYDTIITPYDYSLAMGIRKIQRFQYEPQLPFKDGTESSFSDAASIGRSPFEYLFQVEYKRQEGIEYFDQHHFIRYIRPKWFTKAEYIKDGFADIEYFEGTHRLRLNGGKKLSFNVGAVQRLAEPYGYDPLEEWVLSTGDIHYTNLALGEGYGVVFDGSGGVEYTDPSGNVVAENTQVWEAVVIPEVLSNFVEKKRDELPTQWNQSLVIGLDYYHFTKDFWVHTWGNIMPYHYDAGGEYSYHSFHGGQWVDYSGGLIFGWRASKHLGFFLEGKYNKYWNREWHDFKLGVNYVIF